MEPSAAGGPTESPAAKTVPTADHQQGDAITGHGTNRGGHTSDRGDGVLHPSRTARTNEGGIPVQLNNGDLSCPLDLWRLGSRLRSSVCAKGATTQTSPLLIALPSKRTTRTSQRALKHSEHCAMLTSPIVIWPAARSFLRSELHGAQDDPSEAGGSTGHGSIPSPFTPCDWSIRRCFTVAASEESWSDSVSSPPFCSA